MMAEALLSHAMFPVLSKNLAESQELIKNIKEGNPVLGGGEDEITAGREKEVIEKKDIRTFTVPRSNLKF